MRGSTSNYSRSLLLELVQQQQQEVTTCTELDSPSPRIAQSVGQEGFWNFSPTGNSFTPIGEESFLLINVPPSPRSLFEWPPTLPELPPPNTSEYSYLLVGVFDVKHSPGWTNWMFALCACYSVCRVLQVAVQEDLWREKDQQEQEQKPCCCD